MEVERKTTVVRVRVTEDEKTCWEGAAAEGGVTLSRWIRRTLGAASVAAARPAPTGQARAVDRLAPIRTMPGETVTLCVQCAHPARLHRSCGAGSKNVQCVFAGCSCRVSAAALGLTPE